LPGLCVIWPTVSPLPSARRSGVIFRPLPAALRAELFRGGVLALVVLDLFFFLADCNAHDLHGMTITSAGRFWP
jgi:hypothetical protein